MFYIQELKINNFRCYSTRIIKFSPQINILFGENAVGKTSIVEAIAYLGICKSFRDSKDKDLIKKDEEYFFINGKFELEDEKSTNITVSYNIKDKKIKKNNFIYQKISDYIGYFNVVTFDPSDLYIIKGSPYERRRFLNVNISQIDKNYLISLMKYNKLLKKRNDYLKTNEKTSINHEYLDAITEILSAEAIQIIHKRGEFIEKLNYYIRKAALFITSDKEIVELEYAPNNDENNLLNEYKNKKNYDIVAKTTTVGPHRDDVIIKINSEIANIYGSQGQIRTAIIAIKLGLSEYLRTLNNKQIVLLDDVFSELDDKRQKKLLEFLEKNCQIFITTTNINDLDQAIINQSNLIEIKKGENV